jgi:hypothetical protein
MLNQIGWPLRAPYSNWRHKVSIKIKIKIKHDAGNKE